MKEKLLTGMSCLALTFIITLGACNVEPDSLSSSTALTGIKVNGVSAALESSGDTWSKAAEGVVYLTEAQLSGAKVTVTAGDEKQTYLFAKSNGTGVPAFVEGDTFDFESGALLYVEVCSANRDAVAFYKVRVNLGEPTLSYLGVSFQDTVLGFFGPEQVVVPRFGQLPQPAGDYQSASAGTILIATSEISKQFTIQANVKSPLTTLRYAVAANAAAAPSFSDADNAYKNISLSDGSYIYIEATGAGGDVLFYKTKIAQDKFTATAVSFGGSGTDAVPPIANSWAEAQSGVAHVTDAAAFASVTVSVTPEDAASTIKYGYSADGTPPASWQISNVLSSVTRHGYIGIEITSPHGTKKYYKYRVTYGNAAAELTDISIGGVSATSVGTPGQITFNGFFFQFDGTLGEVSMTSAQAASGTVVASLPAGASAKYGLGTIYFDFLPGPPDPQTLTVDGASLFSGNVPTGTTIYVQVTAEDELTVKVYAVTVTVQ